MPINNILHFYYLLRFLPIPLFVYAVKNAATTSVDHCLPPHFLIFSIVKKEPNSNEVSAQRQAGLLSDFHFTQLLTLQEEVISNAFQQSSGIFPFLLVAVMKILVRELVPRVFCENMDTDYRP